jgi:hypothetical protein
MRKLLLGSAVLTLFAIAITLFQISCQKESNAQTTTYTLPPATTTTLGGVIVGNGLSATPSGVLSVTPAATSVLNLIVYYKEVSANVFEVWTAKYDGTNQTKINISLPANTEFHDDTPPQLSPDGAKVFYTLNNTVTFTQSLYTANINGTGSVKILDNVILGSVY